MIGPELWLTEHSLQVFAGALGVVLLLTMGGC